MVKFQKNNPDESMHRWLSTGSILLPHESLGDDLPESIPYIDSDEETEFPSRAENGKLKSDISTDSKPLPALGIRRSKYRDSLKLLLPWRRPGRHKEELPSGHAGCCSYLSVGWLSRLMQRAFRHGIQKDDLWDLPVNDAARKNAERLERLWKEELRQYGKKASFVRAAYNFCRTRAIISALLICLAMVFQFISPAILLRLLLQNIDDPSSSTQNGIILAFGLYLTQLLRTALLSLAFVIGIFTAIRLQGAIQIFLYNKLLRTRQIGEKQVGQIVNCYTNDMERLFESVVTGSLALATPVMFILTLTYSCHLLGPWALLGHVIILFFYPVMGGLAALTTMLRRKAVKHTDKRVQLMNEVITSIKLIKMYAWEYPFAKKITDVRQSEKQVLQQSAFLQSLSTSISPSIVILAIVATLLGHTLSGNPLNAPMAFTVLTVFLALQFSIGTLPYAVKGIAEGRVALQRMQTFLQIAEVNKWNTGESQDIAAIKIIGATLSWYVPGSDSIEEKKRKHACNRHSNGIKIEECSPLTKEVDSQGESTLKEITVVIKKGSLVGICGSVGSGKSSLLSAICGDMTLLEGSIIARGNIAFVTQQAWIFNTTLRENVLFSLPYDKEKYARVISACCLTQDLELLPQGDLTEIGERGMNLSGGQRQRVSLARALYSNSDLYLLDDPLSAVDTKVASHIFEHCIQASLPEKTILLVTHAMHVLEKCDTVLFMKRGQILERGTHTELMAKDGEYAHMFHLDKTKCQGAIGTDAKKHEEQMETFREESADDDNESSKLITPEDVAVGSISWRAYSHYISALGGPCITGLLLISFIVFVCTQLFSTVWLKFWMDHYGSPLITWGENTTAGINETNFVPRNNDTLSHQKSSNLLEWHYQLIYAMSVVMILIFGIMKGISCAKIVIKAASIIHDQMFKKVLRSPMSFFETSPSGRILNRFSKDMDELDVRIPFFLEIVVQSLLFIIFQLSVSVFVYHLFVIALLLAIILFIILDWWLNVGVREFKRLDNVLRSSVVVHLTTTLQGLSVIRMYCCQASFSNRFYSLVDQHSVAHIIFHLAARWFTFRMEIVGVTVMGSAALTVVLMKGSTTPGSAGLVLAALFQVCTFLPYVMRLKSELLARFTSMERITAYCKDLCEEAPEYVSGSVVPPSWPQVGKIEFRDVSLRYRDGLPLVLNNISFKIEAGQKIGIVGRTGAGKSSLITCLLRLVELDSGSIVIDDIDICTLGLKQLRNSIAVIPQDPVLFEGTVRYNLDPFGDNTDDELWDALDRAHLKYKIGQEEKQLESRVEKNGDNFSVGERQLLCLARALLRKNKVLMLDEATASVDVETDHLIQATIREMFYKCTVITIAHRLNTVWSSDKVLIMKDGKVVEFDSPAALLSREGSIFNSMLGAMGKSN